MRTIYLFQDNTIGFYEHKIDLLRNGYNYDSIEYREIKSIVIKRGLIKNWLILLGFGIASLMISGLLIYNVYTNSSPDDLANNILIFWKGSRGFGILAVLFLIAFGFYSIITSFSKTINIFIETNIKTKQFELRKLYKDKKIIPLIDFLRERVSKVSSADI